MKKIFSALALALTATSIQASDFQKVYQVNHSAADIKTASGNIDDTIIYCRMWGTNVPFKGDIILEAKEGKYRLTFDKMRSIESGVLLAELPQTQKSCGKAMNEYAEELYAKISNWSDF